jgi:exopolysaccharide biosynthesis polyprenyl glycosylphosphotransferase
MPLLKRNAGLITFGQALVDSLCILAAAVFASAYIAGERGVGFGDHFGEHLPFFVAFVLIWCGVATDQRLFASRRVDSLRAQLASVAKAAGVTFIFSSFLVLFFTRRTLDEHYLLVYGGGAILLLLAQRGLVRLVLWQVRRHGFNYRHIVFIGANERTHSLVEYMEQHEEQGHRLVGFLDDEPERAEFLADHGVPYLGKLENLEDVLLHMVVDEVYVGLPVRTYYEKITSIAYLCEGVGTPVRLIADLFPARIAIRRVQQLGEIPLLSLSAVPENQAQLLTKRIMDLAVSGLFLVTVAWWLFPLVALLIKLDSRGPVFFKQERVGLNQRRFKMVKFRSMVTNAEELKAKLAEQNEADGPVFKMKRDPRMTRVGRVIRKFSIDELPQFLNVFAGHMSLVGPRPPVPAEVAEYTWDQRRRLSVRPGITGLQQVSGRSDLSFEEWVELDLSYIDNWTIMTDIRILIRTFEVVVLARGAA